MLLPPLPIVLPLHIVTSYCRFTLPPPVVVSQMPSPRCMSLILTVFIISVALFKDDHLFTCALSTGKSKHGSSLSVSGESDLFDDVSAFTEELTKSFSHTLRKVPIAGMIEKTEMILLREMGANAGLSNFSPRTSISGPPHTCVLVSIHARSNTNTCVNTFAPLHNTMHQCSAERTSEIPNGKSIRELGSTKPRGRNVRN